MKRSAQGSTTRAFAKGSTKIDAARSEIPSGLDVCVSFVLFGNEQEEIERAIAQAQATPINVHVILVDNSQPPLDLDFARRPGVTIVTAETNLGYGRGHNIALMASKGRCRYNLVMNTDLQMGPKVLPGMVAFMDAHLDAGLAMPEVRYPDGSLQRLCRLLPTPADLLGRRFFAKAGWAKTLNAKYEFTDWNYRSVAEFPFLSGCFMMIRRSILDEVGYFDERFFLYAEDLDLSRRIHAIAKTLYVPSQSVIHEYRTKLRPSIRRLGYAAINIARYFNKWGWIRDKERDQVNRRVLEQFAAASQCGSTEAMQAGMGDGPRE